MREGHGADTRRPESLERFCIFAPRVNEDVQPGAALDVD